MPYEYSNSQCLHLFDDNQKNLHIYTHAHHKSVMYVYCFGNIQLQVGLHGGKYVFGGHSIGGHRLGRNAV